MRDDQLGTLSGGYQQRVNIAVGLLGDPAVLLLDEPSSSLDPRQRERLWEFVSGLARDGTTVVYSTHNVAEAERYADRLLVLADGELLFAGTPASSSARRRRTTRTTSRARSSASCERVATDCAGCCSRTSRSCAARRCWSALLVLYPLLVALLVGARAVVGPVEAEGRVRQPGPARRGDDRPRRPASSTPPRTRAELFESVDPIRVDTREEAIEKVRDRARRSARW